MHECIAFIIIGVKRSTLASLAELGIESRRGVSRTRPPASREARTFQERLMFGPKKHSLPRSSKISLLRASENVQALSRAFPLLYLPLTSPLPGLVVQLAARDDGVDVLLEAGTRVEGDDGRRGLRHFWAWPQFRCWPRPASQPS